MDSHFYIQSGEHNMKKEATASETAHWFLA